jgi:hypothetical protein
MFVMTCDITIGQFKPLKPNWFKWSRSINDYSDTASIKLPALCRLKRDGENYGFVPTGLQFTEGMPVSIVAGYNGANVERFRGFIRRINFTVPLELECEGYSYQLRKKEGYTKTYNSTTVRQILADLVEGTDIVLSDNIPNVSLKNIYFRNVKGTDVLEYLKDKCLLTVYFDYNVLYAGLQMLPVKSSINLRLGWNVIKDNELKFEQNKELATVNIQIQKRVANGSRKYAKDGPKNGAVKKLEVRHITDEAALASIAEEQRKKLVYRGYQGKVTGFLFPIAEPGMSGVISDPRYTERTGDYFIEAVEGEFGENGGRQRITIGAAL